MTIDEIYFSLAENIVSSTQDEWELAVLEIKKPAIDAIFFTGTYYSHGNKISMKFRNFDRRRLAQDGNLLHKITTENNANRWNKAYFTLKQSGDFSIDFKWDSTLDDEVKSGQ